MLDYSRSLQDKDQEADRRTYANSRLEILVSTLDTTVLKDEATAIKLSPADKGRVEKLVSKAFTYLDNAGSKSSEQLERYRDRVKLRVDAILKRLLDKLQVVARAELRAKLEGADLLIVDVGRGDVVDVTSILRTILYGQ